MRVNLILSLLTAFLLSFSFPPFEFGFLAYWSLVPFFYLLERKNLKESFRWGYVTGLLISITTIYWINFVTVPGAIATILIHPLYYALYAMLHTFLRQRDNEKFMFAIPFVWTGLEYLKSFGELGFPWVLLGYTQTHYLSLIQYASYTSVFGVSFWVVIINILIYLMLKNLENRKKTVLLLATTIILFILPWLYSRQIIPDEDEFRESLEVAVIQGNIDPYLKWEKGNVELSFDIYERLSRTAAEKQPDLIIWPETATPTYLLHDFSNLKRVKDLIDELNIPLLTGTPDYKLIAKQEYKTYNSVVLLTPQNSRIPVYSKIQLVPFGERVPYEDLIPVFKNFIQSLEMGEGNFSPGEEIVVFELPTSKLNEDITYDFSNGNNNPTDRDSSVLFAVVICFESIFPDLVQQFVKKGAKFLVVVTNDGWFGRKYLPWWLNAGLYQHAQMSVFRAIENRISIARSANTGVSMFIDPYGRVKTRSSIFEEEFLVSSIPLRTETTFFTKYDNIFTKAVSGIGLLFIAVALFLKGFTKIKHHKKMN
jgi:apolipoprotein N-acyltransferase